MKSSLEKLSALERKLNIEVPAQDVQAAFAKAFQGIQKHVTVKGFRKGKAPLKTIKNLYADRVKQDVVQDLVQKSYALALNEHALEPISYPTIEFDQIDDEKVFVFSAEFEIRPEVTLTKVDGLQVKREKMEMKPGFVDETLEHMRKEQSSAIPLLEQRPAQLNDIAIIDFEGHTLTGPLENGKAEGHELELGSNTFIPGFEEGIVGMSVGGSKDIQVTFPETYHAADIAGKPVTFKVKLTELKKKVLPELNDEFAKKAGGYESLDALKSSIQADFEKREQRRIQEDFKGRLIRVLVDNNPVEVPKSLLNEQKKSLIDDFQNRMSQQGMTEQQFEEYKAKWDSDFAKTASFMIQSSFLVDKIALDQKLRADNADFDAKIAEFAAQTGLEVSKVKEFYNDSNRRSRLSYQITEDKVVAFLSTKAKINEVSREELEKEEKHDA